VKVQLAGFTVAAFAVVPNTPVNAANKEIITFLFIPLPSKTSDRYLLVLRRAKTNKLPATNNTPVDGSGAGTGN
jgi:hypothetical protein